MNSSSSQTLSKLTNELDTYKESLYRIDTDITNHTEKNTLKFVFINIDFKIGCRFLVCIINN